MGTATARRGFPAEYRRKSLAQKLSWLASDECGSLVEEGTLARSKVEREAQRIEKERVRIMRITPTPARLDDFMGGDAFPPVADHTPMVRADVVLNPSVEREVYWPAYYVTERDGRTFLYDVGAAILSAAERELDLGKRPKKYDCGEDRAPGHPVWTSDSPTGIAIQHLRDTCGVIEETPIPSDSDIVLKSELAYYAQTGRIAPSAMDENHRY